nr:3'-5' exonuclease [Qipengyuania xiamenensis]
MAVGEDLEGMAKLLESSGRYRILRRLPPDLGVGSAGVGGQFLGLILDTETTGLDIQLDDVIELGMIKFAFSSEGQIGPVVESFEALQEPRAALDDKVEQLTGLSREMLEGHSIDPEAVARFVDGVSLVIAHNAAFDRPFAERICPSFAKLPWACSATEIDWQAEGVGSYKLEYLLNHFGYFNDAHRAIADCESLLFILTREHSLGESSLFSALLDAVRRSVTRIYAEGAPYEMRYALKRRGYRWNDGQDGYPRAWWRDVDPELAEDELTFLSHHKCRDQAAVYRMSARERFRLKATT